MLLSEIEIYGPKVRVGEDLVYLDVGRIDPRHLLHAFDRRGPMIANALAPFAMISFVGALLIVLLRPTYLSWVFIRSVVNAAAAGGDFLGVAWLGKLPEKSRLVSAARP